MNDWLCRLANVLGIVTIKDVRKAKDAYTEVETLLDEKIDTEMRERIADSHKQRQALNSHIAHPKLHN